MKTYPLTEGDGRVYGFEIDNIRRGRVVRIVEGIPGARILEKPKLLSPSKSDEFCRFKLDDQVFTIEEPFGDNSRYLVSADPPGWCSRMSLVHNYFRDYCL